jgi:ProP effector
MGNPSLKEQLQALSLNASPEAPTQEQKKNKNNQATSARATKQKPAWLEHAQYGVELLRAHYPGCFKNNKEEIQPLKIGIKQDLVKCLSMRNDIVTADKACMVNSLAYYVNSAAYYKAVVAGAMRIDLEGVPAGTVTLEEANYTLERSQARLQKKKEKKQE